ncbi:MAG: family 43 glycosylhydrolase [Saprospiraceae bacterium]|nr:family 43 glycosylhydrolase [Saprospiraceae bacterium]
MLFSSSYRKFNFENHSFRYITAIIVISIIGSTNFKAKGQSLDFHKLESPILFRGDSMTAYRDPMAVYHHKLFYLYFTLIEIEPDGKIFSYTALSKSKDLIHWTAVQKLTPRDQTLNFSSPGNVIRYKNKWVMCLQTYPRPEYTRDQMPRYGTNSARLYTMTSKDLAHWTAPQLMKVKGDTVSMESMGRMIDPFLIKDQKDKNKWWVFYKQNGASRSYTNDLKQWHYEGHSPAGENTCIVEVEGQYLMFHSPENGIGIKNSTDLIHWNDWAPTQILGQKEWSWARGRITAGFVLDLSKKNNIHRYLMFFHGSGPKTEQAGDFDKNASIGLAWSTDLKHWDWPK